MSETKVPKFTESCGCVFCDLGLESDDTIGGRATHSHPTRGIGYSFCTSPKPPAPSPPSNGDK